MVQLACRTHPGLGTPRPHARANGWPDADVVRDLRARGASASRLARSGRTTTGAKSARGARRNAEASACPCPVIRVFGVAMIAKSPHRASDAGQLIAIIEALRGDLSHLVRRSDDPIHAGFSHAECCGNRFRLLTVRFEFKNLTGVHAVLDFENEAGTNFKLGSDLVHAHALCQQLAGLLILFGCHVRRAAKGQLLDPALPQLGLAGISRLSHGALQACFYGRVQIPDLAERGLHPCAKDALPACSPCVW
jgi:hypothetical protein